MLKVKSSIPALCLFTAFLCVSLSARANNFGTDEQNFNPSTSRNDFLVVESGNTLDEGQASNDFYMDFTSGGMLFIRRFDPGANTDREEPSNGKSFFNLGFGYGVTEKFDVGLGLNAMVIGAASDVGTYLSTVSTVGLSTVRGNAKYRFYKKGFTRMSALFNLDYMVHTDNAYSGSNAGPNLSGLYAVSFLLYERWIGAFNFGYKHRFSGGTVPNKHVTPMNGQFLYSAALAYIIPSIRMKFLFEGYGSSPMGAVVMPTERRPSNFEGIVATRFFIQKDLHFTVGVGSGFYRGLATPDTRFFLGLSWMNEPNKENEYPYIYETSDQQDHEIVVEESLGEVHILFAKGSSSHESASASEMKKAYDFVRKWKGSIGRMLIEGHTDDTGSEKANQILSETRAKTIKSKIVRETKLDSRKIEVRAYGETQPLGDNGNRAGRAKNRRVVIKVFE